MPEPLIPDAKRQAHDSISGYDYQLWWSLYEWVALRDDVDLYVERAEDFDMVSSGGAVAVQVKKTREAITLRSQDVVQAIGNWWKHCERNPERKVRFRFLTTSSIGAERPPVVEGRRALDVWCQRAGRRPGDLEAIRLHLANQEALPAGLRDYLKEGGVPAIEDVVDRIVWQVDGPARHEVRGLVEAAVVEDAFRLGILPAEAKGAVPRLYQALLEHLFSRSDKPLTRAHYLEALEGSLTQRVPAGQLAAFRRTQTEGMFAMAGVSAGVPHPTVDIDSDAVGLSTVALEDLPPLTVSREPLLQQLGETLARQGALVLNGSTGMGKTTVASLLGRRAGGAWWRLDCRELEGTDLGSALRRACSVLRDKSDCTGLILDDIHFAGRAAQFDRPLLSLLTLARGRRWPVVLTSHDAVPSWLAAHLDLLPISVARIPPLDAQEVRDLLRLHGCPEELLATYGGLVLAKTSGHPQLAHAYARYLRGDGWRPGATAWLEALVDTSALADVQGEAQRHLVQRLSEPQRSLIYRLSLMVGFFRREHALSVADSAAPGEMFDSVVGPWIEDARHGYHRLSPLLQSVGERILSADQVSATRRVLADRILTARPLSQWDVSQALAQSMLAGYDRGTAIAALMALKVPEVDLPALSAAFVWAPLVDLAAGPASRGLTPLTRLIFRTLQVRLAGLPGTDDPELGRVMTLWDAEYHALGAEQRASEWVKMVRLWYLGIVLWSGRCLEPALLARYAAEWLTLWQALEALLASIPERSVHAWSRADATVDLLVSRCRGPKAIRQLLESLASTPGETSAPLLAVLSADAGHAASLLVGLFAARVPLREASSDEEFDRCIESARRSGRVCGVPALTAASYRALAIREFEHRKNSAGALAILEEGKAAVGGAHALLDDYRATILSEMGREEEALGVWEALSSGWQDAAWVRAFSYRAAGIVASRLGRHSEAAVWFERAAGAARKADFVMLAVGLTGEQALASWRAGERERACQCFALALRQVGEAVIPEFERERGFRHRLLGYALLWTSREGIGPGGPAIVEPVVGSLSLPKLEAELGAEGQGPSASEADCWGLLACLEAGSGLGRTIEDEWRSRFSPSAPMKLRVARARAVAALHSLALLNMVSVGGELAGAFGEVRLEQGVGGGGPPRTPLTGNEAGEIVAEYLAAAVTCWAASPRVNELPVRVWREDDTTTALDSPALMRCIELAEQGRSAAELRRVVRDGSEPASARLVASALVALEAFSPEDLMLALINLVVGWTSRAWANQTEQAVLGLVERGWRGVVAEQAHALVAPGKARAAILGACEDSRPTGWAKSASVLLVASEHLGGGLPEGATDRLRALAAAPKAGRGPDKGGS